MYEEIKSPIYFKKISLVPTILIEKLFLHPLLPIYPSPSINPLTKWRCKFFGINSNGNSKFVSIVFF